MNKHMDVKTVVLIGRTFDEYYKMFNLDNELLKNEIFLDAASGVSSFCAEANAKGFNVTASDKIYCLHPDEIETKCEQDLDSVMQQMPAIADIYLWDFFKDIQSLKANREKAYRSFLEDFKKYGIKRYKPVEYPITDFRDEQFTVSLVSHLLFLYEDKLDYDFHKKTIQELLRVSSREIRIFPVVNFKGIRSGYIELLVRDQGFRNLKISIKRVGYEFMKNANEMMIIKRK
ncbi:MAG: hypothetical protein FIB07_14120 [Candidatus Methanoperedens sp.]|nr:hypothetical protein [Candidatus Methanoperedens sp.]